LVNRRISLINGCAYCIDIHTRDLIKKGANSTRFVLTPVWDEAEALFSASRKGSIGSDRSATSFRNTPEAAFAING
jgi:AhpD family alkylhydroperoxidase